jgi:hypothetical protein
MMAAREGRLTMAARAVKMVLLSAVEAACARAHAVGGYRYHTIKTILMNALDQQPLPALTPPAPAAPAVAPRHARPWTTFFPDPGAMAFSQRSSWISKAEASVPHRAQHRSHCRRQDRRQPANGLHRGR